MMIIGVDYHPSFQTVAFLMEESGECGEQELKHSDGEAERFYRDLQQRGICVRVGLEATGYSRWFERLLAELGIEVWIGERALSLEEKAVQRRGASAVRETRTGSLGQSAPERVVGTAGPHESDHRELTAAVEREARKRPEVMRLMTHPGVGPLTALAFVLIIGTWERFPCGKQIGNYVGMIPCEDSSAGKQRLGHISKQGSSLLRFLLVEAAQAAARKDPDWRRRYLRLAMRRHQSIAKVAMGRRLAVRLYWMWRNGWEYSQSLEFGSYAGQLGTGHGVN